MVFYSWINPEQHSALFIIMLSVSESLFPHCLGWGGRKCSVFSEIHCKLKLQPTSLTQYPAAPLCTDVWLTDFIHFAFF